MTEKEEKQDKDGVAYRPYILVSYICYTIFNLVVFSEVKSISRNNILTRSDIRASQAHERGRNNTLRFKGKITLI